MGSLQQEAEQREANSVTKATAQQRFSQVRAGIAARVTKTVVQITKLLSLSLRDINKNAGVFNRIP